jgi:hypothetical protein
VAKDKTDDTNKSTKNTACLRAKKPWAEVNPPEDTKNGCSTGNLLTREIGPADSVSRIEPHADKNETDKICDGGNPGAVLCCASEQPNRGDRLSWRALLENKNLSGNEKSGRAAPTPWELERGNNTNHKKMKSDWRLNQGNKTGLKRSLDAWNKTSTGRLPVKRRPKDWEIENGIDRIERKSTGARKNEIWSCKINSNGAQIK